MLFPATPRIINLFNLNAKVFSKTQRVKQGSLTVTRAEKSQPSSSCSYAKL